MGFLDQLWGGARNLAGQKKGALSGLLLSVLGGGSGRAEQAGGLRTLITRFEQTGLGDVVHSWVANGPANKPVTPDQVHQALGDQHVQTLAEKTGLPKNALLVQLAALLPQLVDGMTPNGQVPNAPPAAGQKQPRQAAGEAEAPARGTEAVTAAKAVQQTDPTEPVQSAGDNAGRQTG